ncbi:MAG TPA: zinc-binding alcohol dehydrogenase family protein [Polyangiaceae bacterium]|nr:zinc-binding alcohol dehydrogenase family protein [Polyangiaceae bacterium]
MFALRFERTGDLSALELVERPLPEPEPGDLVVCVVAAGLNPSDVKNVEGYFSYTTLPRTPGRDFSGIVARGPAELVGTAVWGTGKELGFTRDGGHAEFVTVPIKGVARKPDALGFEEAACVGVPYTTAWSALERCGVSAGQNVVVTGATGAVGQAAVDLATWRGAHVLGTVRRPAQRISLEARGVRAAVVEHAAALPEAVSSAFPGGADVVFDTTGAYLAEAVAALAVEGRIAVIAAPRGGNVEVPVLPLYRRGGVVVGVNSLLYDTTACAKVLDRLGAAFAAGKLPPPRDFTVTPFSGALAAYADVKAGSAGKRVLVMSRP